MTAYSDAIEKFSDLVRRRRRDRTMAAFIVDSPWLPGYAGIGTLDFYFDDAAWLAAHRKLLEDLPGVAFVPGAWVEYGMAAEPSAWGARIRWTDAGPPGIRRSLASLADLAEEDAPDPEADGLLPLVLRRYERLRRPLEAFGFPPRMAAARGPLAVAAQVYGLSEFLLAVKTEREAAERFLEKTSSLCVRFLRAQLERMEDPVGILVLDDVVGMLGPRDAAALAFPRLEGIFREFEGLVRVFHDDAPNPAVYPGLAKTGMDVFNFTHETDLRRARELLGPDVVLMGNLPPLDLLVRGTPEEAREAARRELELLGEVGPLVVSAGGGVSPGTPVANLRAVAEALEGGGG